MRWLCFSLFGPPPKSAQYLHGARLAKFLGHSKEHGGVVGGGRQDRSLTERVVQECIASHGDVVSVGGGGVQERIEAVARQKRGMQERVVQGCFGAHGCVVGGMGEPVVQGCLEARMAVLSAASCGTIACRCSLRGPLPRARMTS